MEREVMSPGVPGNQRFIIEICTLSGHLDDSAMNQQQDNCSGEDEVKKEGRNGEREEGRDTLEETENQEQRLEGRGRGRGRGHNKGRKEGQGGRQRGLAGKGRRREDYGGDGDGLRGGRSATSVWASSEAVEDSQSTLPQACARVLANLAAQGNILTQETLSSFQPQLRSSRHSKSSSAPQDAISAMKNMLSEESWKESQVAFQVNSLENIILCCQRSNNVEVGVQFISMINFIQLAAKVESTCQARNLSSGTEVLCQELGNTSYQHLHICTLQKWLANGTKFAILAGANLEKSDIFFDSLPLNGFYQEHNWEAWADWGCSSTTLKSGPPQFSVSTFNHSILSIGSSSPECLEREGTCAPSPCSEDDNQESSITLDSNIWEALSNANAIVGNPNQITIQTNFDSTLPKNCDLICPSKDQQEEHFKFTLGERRHAELAKVPASLEEMQTLIQSQLLQNGKKRSDAYVKVQTSLFPDYNLRINENNGSSLAFIIPTMPDNICKSLLDNLNMIFPGALCDKDTKSEGINNFFEALHLSWEVITPKDANPTKLRLGKK
ncbi:hypothetical protein L208DRAFT_1540934 [Tricholoma matsutake]|nr:hypothetical protein L208DRAFT_1540934 [Tricholoma matsutake 945]